MSVYDAIAEAIANSDPPPRSEVDTCHRIIYPLLRAAGYSHLEIEACALDNVGKFPDYTLLPALTEATWYLEAKSWNEPLAARHAQQSVSYAFHNGRRWVVLTNGRVWQLYDSTIQGLAADRLAAEAHLTDSDAMAAFLTAICRESVLTDRIAHYATRSRLARMLESQLVNGESDFVKAVYRWARAQPGMSAISRDDVVSYFRSLNDRPPSQARSATVETVVAADTSDRSIPERVYTLKQLNDAGAAVTHTRPIRLTFPGGQQEAVATWTDVALKVVSWFADHGRLPPLPFRGLEGGRRWFLNVVPEHPDRPMNVSATIPCGGRLLYIHTNRSSREIARCLYSYAEAVGQDPASFLVLLSEPLGTD